MKVGFFVPDAKGRPQKNGESLAWLVQIPQGGAPDPAIQWGVRNPYKWPKRNGPTQDAKARHHQDDYILSKSRTEPSLSTVTG